MLTNYCCSNPVLLSPNCYWLNVHQMILYSYYPLWFANGNTICLPRPLPYYTWKLEFGYLLIFLTYQTMPFWWSVIIMKLAKHSKVQVTVDEAWVTCWKRYGAPVPPAGKHITSLINNYDNACKVFFSWLGCLFPSV